MATLIRFESPLLIETIVSTGVALGGLLKTYEWIRDRPERRRIVRAEADKIEEEAKRARLSRKREETELARLQREGAGALRTDLRQELMDAAPELEQRPEALEIVERSAAR